MSSAATIERGVLRDAPAPHGIYRDKRPGRRPGLHWRFPYPSGKAQVDEVLRFYPKATVAIDHNPIDRYYVRVILEEADATPRDPKPYVDVERARGKQITKSLRKTGFTDAQKREAKTRDGGCVGSGRYGECSGKQPIELCQVDHVDPDGPNALWNAQTLCGNCHDWKTAVENGWWTP
jgi:hypothetical protein